MAGGDRGLVSWKSRTSEFVDNLDVVAGIGERLGCRAFNALYGLRNDECTAEEADALGVENLVRAAPGCARHRRHGLAGAGVGRRRLSAEDRG